MRRTVVFACALAVLAGPAGASSVAPDPGGAGAWATGVAPLADPPGPLALFDQPGRTGSARAALALQRARLFELEGLTRVRAAFAYRRGAWTFALGAETFGPPGVRRARVAVGAALVRAGTSAGLAWSERRNPAALGGGRAGALDASATAVIPGTRGRVAAQLSLRALASGGDPAAQADPDWTAEATVDLGPARAHLARTRDLHGARTGGGVALGSGALSLCAGAVGPPASWTIGVAISARAARAGFARIVHPVLGASDLVEGSAAW